MKRVLIAAFAVTIGLSTMISDAEAKRLGGGKSVGMNRSADTMKAPAAPPAKQATAAPAAAPAAAAAAAPKSGMSRWLGPLAGLAAGIGLAALFSHLGMGEAMGNFVMIALLVLAAVVVFKLLFRKKQPEAEVGGMQYAGAGAGGVSPPPQFDTPAGAGVGVGETAVAGATEAIGATGATAAASARSIPADFDVEGFVRQAKLNYIRLQAANDRGDLDDIKQFTSPEMFAEIQMQFQERGKSVQETDVMVLNAELLDVTEEAAQYIASVRFFGQIREEAHAAPEAFDELWHLTKPRDGSRGWAVAGIQQFQ
jgi:predicted lipid-binding transport protein (Tim44 family)